MAEHEDPRVSAGYRALGEERPPQALDDAILAASRRAVGAGPQRAGTSRVRRWALPVSIAAVVVLTMSLVVRIQLERPDLEAPLPPVAVDKPAGDAKEEDASLAKRNEQQLAEQKAKVGAAPSTAAERERQALRAPVVPAPAPATAPPAKAFVPEPPARKAAPAESVAESAMGAARAPAAPSAAEGGAAAGLREDAAAGRLASSTALEDRAQASAERDAKKDEAPRAWLERIARLRREGRVKEADDSLVEFRRRYPGYEIPKEMRAAVLGEPSR